MVKAAGETAALVQLINKVRRNDYQKLAAANSLQLADVEILAGQKALNKTPSAHFILQDGKWLKKRPLSCGKKQRLLLQSLINDDYTLFLEYPRLLPLFIRQPASSMMSGKDPLVLIAEC